MQLAPSAVSPATIAFYRTLVGVRADNIIPAGSLMAADAGMTISSDWDADELSPLIKLSIILSREVEGFANLTQALRAYTINAARLLGQDGITGSLEIGKRADLVIVDQNLIEISSQQLASVQVLATIFNGELVFELENLFP